ncbi:MAG: citrate/2-methylcitrate synthase [Propionibacteriaceae bacterium]|jgi:citrate synthase|nr:citrate/2-methylcitrate synthase [Propionibacteriaceae bacterium]
MNNETRESPDYAGLAEQRAFIPPELFVKYEVKRGLRDSNGTGVLAGITGIAEVKAYEYENGEKVPCAGSLRYRGYDVRDLIEGCAAQQRYGFEEAVYLLLFGELPNAAEFEDFKKLLVASRELRSGFTRDVILKAPSPDMVNAMARCVLTLYSYDERPDSTDIANVMRQSLQLISVFPRFAVYSYQAAQHYHEGASLWIHSPEPELGIAENILHMLRPDNSYSPLEARTLDTALVLHAEHGGGNNSTFSTHVVTSTGTDTYSAIATALGSLKGPRHGGANIKVARQFAELKQKVKHWDDDDELRDHLTAQLEKRAFDGSGLIYGMGHAVYTLSDPRCLVLRDYAAKLAAEKGRTAEFELYRSVERVATQLLQERRKVMKPVCANVDFYSGFVYDMLGIPEALFTPIFAVARVAGWCAHRIEELVSGGKIIRPAYKSVCVGRDYVGLDERGGKLAVAGEAA